MTQREPDPLRHPLEGEHRLHLRALTIRHALRAASWCAVAIAAAVLAGALFALGVTGAWLRLFALTAGLLALAIAAATRFSREAPTLAAFLERVEESLPALRSWIRNAVDFEGARLEHVSPALATAVRDEARRRLSESPLASLRPGIQPRAALLRLGSSLGLILALGLLLPARTSLSWSSLWNPGAAAPPVELVVEPGSVTVSPGATLAVHARVRGTDQAPRLDRDAREPRVEAVPEGREERGARLWRFDLAQLTRTQEYWVRVAGAKSPRYRITLSGELAPVSFEVEYRPPSYARLPVQRGMSARGDLTALKGTTASMVVTFDRDLERLSARMPGARTSEWTAVTPRRWRGTVPIVADGEYELNATARREDSSGKENAASFRYRVTALADAPPVLVVQLPEGDVDLPAGQQIPLAVLAQDDLGLTELTLQIRKGPEDAWTDRPLASFDQRPREARVESRWDASALGLLPGTGASFRFVLWDDNAISGRGRAVSPTYELRFPSLADMYERVDDRQSGAQKSLEKVAEQSRELQKSLEKLERQPPRNPAPAASFERSQELRSALERQQEMGKTIDQAAEQLRQSIEQASERNAFDDDLMRKLRQVNELMKEIQSDSFKEALRKMQQAMENLQRQPVERSIPEWRARNQEMIKNLERTIDLLKKLREEEKLQGLAARAKELEAQQNQLNREHQEAQSKAGEQGERSDLADRQEKAAGESEDLAKEAREAGMKSEEASEKLDQAAEQLGEQAAPAQRDASDAAKDGETTRAQSKGQTASKAISGAAESMQQAAQESQGDPLDLAAVRRAAQDLVSLQRASEGALSSSASADEKADRQTDLSEGAARVADSLFQLSRRTPFISPRLGEALGRSIKGMMGSGKELANGNRAGGEDMGRAALQSLNEAVLELRAAEGAMCNQPGSGEGAKGNNQQRISDLGKKQSQINQETRSIAQKLTEQMRLSSGDRQHVERLAQEQARIREQLEEIRRTEEARQELLGRLDQAQKEMKEVEEIMTEGTLGADLEEKQTRILSRLLDAQRSVNRRDFDPQRESRGGEDVTRAGPAELPADLLRQSDRFRQDLLRSELDRYPAQYRAFVEAYLRQLNGSRR